MGGGAFSCEFTACARVWGGPVRALAPALSRSRTSSVSFPSVFFCEGDVSAKLARVSVFCSPPRHFAGAYRTLWRGVAVLRARVLAEVCVRTSLRAHAQHAGGGCSSVCVCARLQEGANLHVRIV